MKLPFALAVLSVSGALGLAAAAVPLVSGPVVEAPVESLGVSKAPVLVLQPLPADRTATDAAQPAGRAVQALALAIVAEIERVDRLPRPFLLPDGEIVLSHEPAEGGLVRDFAFTELPAAAPAAPRAPIALPEAAHVRRAESPGLPDELARPRGAPAPDTTVEPQVRAFDPRDTHVVRDRAAFVGGGIAVATLAGLAVLLYHRIRPNAALENETRKVIFEAVCGQPGLGVHEISRMAGVSYSTATYHLERLVGAGMIVMTPDGNKLCYYKNGGAFTESERRILPLLKNAEAVKLFEAILEQPGTYRAALAEKLGVTATTINWHLRRLREAGLVDETRMGRSAHLYARIEALRPLLITLAAKVEPSEPVVAEKIRAYAGQPAEPGDRGVVGAA